MSPSDDELLDFVRSVARVRAIAIEPAWIPEVALHARRLLDAAEFLERSSMTSQELAPRFEP